MRKFIMITVSIIVLLGIAAGIAFYFSSNRLAQFGATPDGARLERIRKSPNYDGDSFVNPVATRISPDSGGFFDAAYRWFFGRQSCRPGKDLTVEYLHPASFDTDTVGELRIYWLGHATLLIEIDGYRVLTDPVWSKRYSPSSLFGPVRFHPVPVELGDLPSLDAVVISHDHYDHLDMDAVVKLAGRGVPFLVPLGVGAHLEKWGINPDRIIEHDWWDSTTLSGIDLEFVAAPARHFSGRTIDVGSNKTLWVSWAIAGRDRRVLFIGDTGEFPGLDDIGSRLGPFDFTCLPIGAYDKDWPEIHFTPEQAVMAHSRLKGDVLIPIHWGTFDLAPHDWFEPPERLLEAARANKIRTVVPRPGQRVSAESSRSEDPWWRDFK